MKNLIKNIKTFFKALIDPSNNNGKNWLIFKDRPDLFAINCLKISSYETTERKPIKLAPYQRYVLSTIYNNRQTIFKMPRQSTKTTLALISAIHYAIFNDNVTVGIISSVHQHSKRLSDFAKLFVNDLGTSKYFNDYYIECGVRSIEFENKSKVEFLSASTLKNNFKGINYDFLIFDEFAFFYPIDSEIISSFIQYTNTKYAIISTQKKNSKFNEMFWNAMNDIDDSEMIPINIHYREIPERDRKWREETIRLSGHERFKEEYM